eukprot:4786476-Pyramimonas_sp.AAC.1
MAELASSHPLASTVDIHPCEDWIESPEDTRGRATQGNQSQFFLTVRLACTGMVFKVGLSTRKTHRDLLRIWWAPSKACAAARAASYIRAARQVLFDIAELDVES